MSGSIASSLSEAHTALGSQELPTLHPEARFRFGTNRYANHQARASSGWNTIPNQRTLPPKWWETPAAAQYLATMDAEMATERQATQGGWSTRLAFKGAFHRAEQRFRLWLLAQPGHALLNFVRDFGIYDQRVVLMVLRYKCRHY